VFALNRGSTDEMQLDVELRGLKKRRLVLASSMIRVKLKKTLHPVVIAGWPGKQRA
jgi:hypothetical protein